MDTAGTDGVSIWDNSCFDAVEFSFSSGGDEGDSNSSSSPLLSLLLLPVFCSSDWLHWHVLLDDNSRWLCCCWCLGIILVFLDTIAVDETVETVCCRCLSSCFALTEYGIRLVLLLLLSLLWIYSRLGTTSVGEVGGINFELDSSCPVYADLELRGDANSLFNCIDVAERAEV